MDAAPSLIAEARQMLPAFEAATRAASDQERIAILVMLASIVGKPEALRTGTRAVQEAFWRKYHDLLSHVPAAALNRACDAFLAAPTDGQGKWFPDPGTILQHARADDKWRDDARMKRGLDALSRARGRERREPLTAGEEAAIEAKWQAFQQRNKALRAQAVAEHDAEISAAKEWATGPRPWETKPKQADAA